MPGPDAGDDEFALIRNYLFGLDQGPAVTLGNGDDAALLRMAPGEEMAVSTDIMVEGVHFLAGSPAAAVAYRAVAAAASDLAAMGAAPAAMTIALTLPAADESWLREYRAGLADAVTEFSLPLIGGDVSRGQLALAVQVFGSLPAGQALRRGAARPGDLLCVSGTLGDAAAGLALLRGQLAGTGPAVESLLRRFWRPTPRLELGVSLRGLATAAIDISDGLLADAGHVARASAAQLCIDSDRLPVSDALRSLVDERRAREFALSGGEDYELCFTVPADAQLPPGITVIGTVRRGEGVLCDVEVSSSGYRHFQ